MPIDKELLDILVCPKTKVDVEILPVSDLENLNKLIREGKIKYNNGEIVYVPVEEALVTIDRKTIYRIDDNIPVMLIDKGIPYDQLN